MFQDVIVASLFRTFHERLDDALLDRAAREAGCESGIGRLCLLDDDLARDAVAALDLVSGSRLIDVGCGRGFLARWLARRGPAIVYCGIDRIPAAIAAARRLASDATFFEGDYRGCKPEVPFDALTAFEVSATGELDATLLDAIATLVRPGGRFVVTAAAWDGGARFERDSERLRARFDGVVLYDATDASAAFARRYYGAQLAIDAWDTTIGPRIAAQANDVLAAIDAGSFRYAIVSGRVPDTGTRAERLAG